MTEPRNADEDLAARLGVHPGLCGGCRFRELLASKRSVFLRCGRAATDPRFMRYPPLPVLRCPGYVAGDPPPAPRPAG